ncbi:MAG TPA: DNA topoisomerase I [Methanocorpusculum sp.]|nr:DNA topoisomerase I [Methanocorpusculum sp.]
MHLIIAEKNLVAERIAHFLSGKEKVKAKKDGNVTEYSFDDTVVMGLRGHVVEVDFVDGYTNWRSKEHPPRSLINAEIIKNPTEKKIVSLMQKLAKKASRVTIATDYDTEGELIGKEALELIRKVNKNVLIDRAKFSAVTKEEIVNAIENAGPLDVNLALAGESRQIIDLVWGASLTRFLSIAGHRGAGEILSAGRVQSPTLAMVVNREVEIENFVPSKYWMLTAEIKKDDDVLEIRHTHGKYVNYDEAKAAYDATNDPVIVEDVATGHKCDRAPTPLDTTALIVGAGRLGISASFAMSKAEELYMRGYISYPRTDNTVYPKSLNISEHLRIFEHGTFAKDAEYVRKNLRDSPSRGKRSTTDHPPIYPTSIASPADINDAVSWKLYEFIVRRFFATITKDAEWETMKVSFSASKEPYVVTGARQIFSGWRKIYPYSKAEDNILPVFKKGEVFALKSKKCDEKETQPPARYSQSKLIMEMEELGLGTKSTRHEIISKLAGRKYIEGNPLKPTVVGRAVTESLEDYADLITKPDMTKTLEEHMKEIAEGKRSYDSVLSESKAMLSEVFDELDKNVGDISDVIMNRSREGQIIGKCPVCGKNLIIKRVGGSQFIGCLGFPDCSFNIGLPPAAWGNAVKIDEVCEIHGLHSVQLLRKGAPPWKIGCPMCSHLKTNTETFKIIPSMTDDLISKLHSNYIYTLSDLLSSKDDPDSLAEKLGMNKADVILLLSEAENVLMILRKRTELKKFITSHVPKKRGRGYSKICSSLISAGVENLESLAKIDKLDLVKLGLSDDEASALLFDANHEVNFARMKEFGVPTVSLKKYSSAGFDNPEFFVSVHPAGISLASGVSITTVCSHQRLVAEKLCRPAPEKLSKASFEKGIEPLKEKIDSEYLIPLALAGVFSVETLMKSDISTLSKVTGIESQKIKSFVGLF